MTKEEIQSAIQRQKEIIIAKEAALSSGDYKIIKSAEAQILTLEITQELQDVIEKRIECRRAINEAEAEIARLEALEPEDEVSRDESAEL